MRIVQHTPQQMTLQEVRPRVSFISLFGLPFLAAGVLTILNIGEWVVAQCDRLEPTQITCTVENRTLLRHEVRTVSRVQGAEVEAIVDDEGQDTYRVRLLTQNESVPLTQATTSGRRGKQKTVDRINAFVNAADQVSLQVRQDFRWFAYPVGGLCSLAGAAAVVLGSMPFKRATCRLDKTIGQGTWQGCQGFILLSKQEFPLQAIQAVKIHTSKDSEDMEIHSAHLILNTGESLLLQTGYDLAETKKVATTIRQFLGITSDLS